MDRRMFDFSEMYTASENHRQNDRDTDIPDCFDDDYCVMTPVNRNNGILTMAFVDMQPLDSVYELNEAFDNGTLFSNLNKPFYGGMKR